MDLTPQPFQVDPKAADLSPATFNPAPFDDTTEQAARATSLAVPIGCVADVSGHGATVLLEIEKLERLAKEDDQMLQLAGRVGTAVRIRVSNQWLVANIHSLTLDTRSGRHVRAEISFVGEGLAQDGVQHMARFRRGVSRFPLPGQDVFAMCSVDLDEAYGCNHFGKVEIGTVYPTLRTRAALLVDPFLSRHFAILGSTGTGKSTATALILHRICEVAPEGHLVMIDPHGEYGRAFATNGELFDSSNLALPYWLMNFEEHCEVMVTAQGDERAQDCEILGRCVLAARARNRAAEGLGRLTVDSPVPYLLSDLSAILQAEMGKLDKATNNVPYMRLKTRIDEIRNDPRYTFMFSGMLVGDSFAAFIARLLRLPAMGRPISIVDMSAMPSEIIHVVVSVLSRLIFDYATWSRQDGSRPIVLICEEAHRYIPPVGSRSAMSASKILQRIAKEGRKYGISLGLITQRPSDIDEGVLSQCGTIVTMRLNNERDQAIVRSAMPEGSRAFLSAITSLRNRQAIISGEGVTIPLRVSFDDLEPAKRPASSDPVFLQTWRKGALDTGMIDRTIHRWRHQRNHK
jgi:uncharacterized protein